MPDEQDRAEALDDDKVGGEYPPERPLGAHRRQDDAIVESFAGRGARTEPEVEEVSTPGDDVDVIAADEPPVAPDDEIAVVPEAAEEAAIHLQELPGDEPQLGGARRHPEG
jgi:hypothetical protein